MLNNVHFAICRRLRLGVLLLVLRFLVYGSINIYLFVNLAVEGLE